MSDYKAFIQQLLSLANNSLQPSEQLILEHIITQVLDGLEMGSTCLDINNLDLKNIKENIDLNYVLNILEKSNLVGYYSLKDGCLAIKPLTLMQIPLVNSKKNILYITRHFYYELEIAKKLKQLQVSSKVDKNLADNLVKALKSKIYSGFPNFEQLNAINTSLFNKLSIITGGPGTGKTTTVVLLLWVLIQLYDNLNIQVCAPTGKASARIKESIYNNIFMLSDSLGLDISFLQKKIDEINFGTIHKLLNYKINDIYFNYNENSPLNVDVLIIDEASMISLPLFYKLLNAVEQNSIKHIVFLGDKNQLSSVEEGYVFASLIKSYSSEVFAKKENIVSELLISNRSNIEISKFAENILYNRLDFVINSLLDTSKVKLKNPDLSLILRDLFDFNNEINIINYLNFIKTSDNISFATLFQIFRQVAILCLTRIGKLGVINLNNQIEILVKKYLRVSSVWYTGRPVIILENDYNLGLYNGDIGICVIKDNKTLILFEDKEEFIPELLPKYELAYALTIHKSQGSEFDNVIIVIPENDKEKSNINTMLSRELLYTAVTRAKKTILMYFQDDSIKTLLNSNVERQTGLDYLLSSINLREFGISSY